MEASRHKVAGFPKGVAAVFPIDSGGFGDVGDDAGEAPDNDPGFYGIDVSYMAALNNHVPETLGFNPDRQYVAIGEGIPRLGGRPKLRIEGIEIQAGIS